MIDKLVLVILRVMINGSILLYFIFKINLIFAQSNNFSISFHPTFGKLNLLLVDTFLKSGNGDSIQIETLKFYISRIELLNEGEIVWKEENSFHLIDAENVKSMNISFTVQPTINFNQIRFNIGIDSTTNVSGAMGGDLDPTRGMYWTWQNGYINFKLEGKSNLCNTRNNEFQFHLGGYQYPYSTLQTLILNTSAKEKIDIIIDIKRFTDKIDLANLNHVMSPGKDAIFLSESLPEIFFIKEK